MTAGTGGTAGPPPGVPQPLSIPTDALKAIVAGNRAALGLPPQGSPNAHECTRHCGPGYHPDRVTVGLIEANERNPGPGVIHHVGQPVSAGQGAAAATPGQAAPVQMAITEHGTLKPVSEFARAEKWWCDGEDCDGPGGPDLPGTPHVHPMYGPARPVDLLTGRAVTP